MNRMSVIHIWIGNTQKSLDEFEAYFNLDTFYESEEDEDFEKCGFCEEITFSSSYSEDFIGLDYKNRLVKIEEILTEIPSTKIIFQIISSCKELKIEKANAMFYYRDAELPKPIIGKVYNDLQYVGQFNLNE